MKTDMQRIWIASFVFLFALSIFQPSYGEMTSELLGLEVVKTGKTEYVEKPVTVTDHIPITIKVKEITCKPVKYTVIIPYEEEYVESRPVKGPFGITLGSTSVTLTRTKFREETRFKTVCTEEVKHVPGIKEVTRIEMIKVPMKEPKNFLPWFGISK
jgi:hypothetical protein